MMTGILTWRRIGAKLQATGGQRAGTGGDMAVTSGRYTGTSGESLLSKRFLRLFGILAAFILVVSVVNISSILIEDPAGERDFAAWEPMLWEGSSAFAILLLLPAVWRVYHRFHWRGRPLWQAVGLHAAAALLFSLVHVAIMVAVRIAGYAMDGARYDFAQGDLLLQLVYEGRKDAISYAILFAAMWTEDRLAQAKTAGAPPELPEKLEVRADGRTLFIAPEEVVQVEAAGNYVELHMAEGRPLLVRGTLAEYEARLKKYGFVRVHRSRLLNRRHMAGFEGTPSGDLRIRLNDGRDITGSRRYRQNL